MQKAKVVTQSKLEFEATEGYQEVIAFFEVSLACAQMIDFKKDFSVTGALLLLVPFMFFAMVLAMAGGALLIALGHLTLELYRIVLGSSENAFSDHMMFLTMLGTLFVMPLVTGGSIWLVRKQLQKDDEANSIAFLPTLQRAHQLIVQDLDRVHFLTQAPTLIEPLFFKELSKEKKRFSADYEIVSRSAEAVSAFLDIRSEIYLYLDEDTGIKRHEISLKLREMQKKAEVLLQNASASQIVTEPAYEDFRKELKRCLSSSSFKLADGTHNWHYSGELGLLLASYNSMLSGQNERLMKILNAKHALLFQGLDEKASKP